MKKWSIYLLLSVMLLGVSQYTVAQDKQEQTQKHMRKADRPHRHHGERHARKKQKQRTSHGEMYVKRLDKMVSLSADQKSEIKAIQKENAAARKTLWENKELDRKEKRGQMMDLWKKTQKEVSQVLTKEQNEKLEKMRQKRRSHMRRNHANHRGQHSFRRADDGQ